MQTHVKKQVLESSLALEVWNLFLKSKNSRKFIEPELRQYSARSAYESEFPSIEKSWEKIEADAKKISIHLEKPSCGCVEHESCDLCTIPDQEVCTVKDTVDLCKKRNVFDGLSTLITLVKAADYTAAVESYYAPVGNKPMELKAPAIVDPRDTDLQEAADTFYDYIENFLRDNQVKITELADAMNLESLPDAADQLRTVAINQLQLEEQEGLDAAEKLLERLFGQVGLMTEYLKVIKDTEDSPIGVLWCNSETFVRSLKAASGKVRLTRDIKPSVERIDPCYFWATPDWTNHQVGRAVFRLVEKTNGDLEHLKKHTPHPLKQNIADLLEDSGHKNFSAHLFVDDMELNNGIYDVLICRGYFDKSQLFQAGVKVESDERMIAAEVWYAKGMLIYAEQLPDFFEKLGVFTTYFRNNGDSIWGISLHDFIRPFAKMYEGTIKVTDRSVAKSVGSIVSMDTGVIPDFATALKRNADGTYEIDFTSDTVLPFDSTEAGLSPNFKGIPIHVTKLPHDLNELFPVLNMIFQQIEVITGIPSILSTGTPDSSAVRTDGSYRTAFRAANAKIASIIRRARDSVLIPAVKFFYYSLIESGELKGFPIEAYPEVLADKRLELEKTNARNMAGILSDLGPYAQMLPPDRVAGIINQFGRELYGLNYDLVPGVNPIGNTSQSQLTEAA